MSSEIKQALAYRVGSFLLASTIAWAILASLRGTTWSSAAISFFTSGILQFTHTVYYIIFHRLWGKGRDEPRVKAAVCRQLEIER